MRYGAFVDVGILADGALAVPGRRFRYLCRVRGFVGVLFNWPTSSKQSLPCVFTLIIMHPAYS